MSNEPYSTDPFPNWGDVVASWDWEVWNDGGGQQEGMKKAGPCPRCQETMIVYQRFAHAFAPESEWVEARCNCGQQHEGRPPDAEAEGCGQSAEIQRWEPKTTQPSAGAQEPSSRPIGPKPTDQAKWEEEAVKFHVEQLTRVRGAAEKWTGTVATLLGVFGTVAAISGTATLDKINSDDLRWTIVGLVSVAGVAAIVSIAVGALAAQGAVPKRRENWSGVTYRSWVTDETPKAAKKLAIARVAGLIAAGLVFAIGLLSLITASLPGAPSPASVVVVDGNGQLRCGKLQAQSDGTATLDGKPVPGQISQVISVSKC
jgi:hypothetical protein